MTLSSTRSCALVGPSNMEGQPERRIFRRIDPIGLLMPYRSLRAEIGRSLQPARLHEVPLFNGLVGRPRRGNGRSSGRTDNR